MQDKQNENSADVVFIKDSKTNKAVFSINKDYAEAALKIYSKIYPDRKFFISASE